MGKECVKCSLTDLPFIHSVARELEAMAEPQPKVLNLASTIFPWSSTWTCHIESFTPRCAFSFLSGLKYLLLILLEVNFILTH